MSMRTKIQILLLASVIICTTLTGLFGIYIVNTFVTDYNDEDLHYANGLAVSLLNQHSEDATRASGMVAENEQMIEAVLQYINSGDRQPLVNASVALLNAAGVDFLTVLDTSGNVMVRAHEPDNFGDSLANQANIQNAMKGQQYTTIEKGTAVKLSVRCGTPILDSSGNLIGVISLGYRLDQSGFVDYIRRMTNTEVTVFLGDTRISTTILTENGDRAIDTKASENVSKTVLAGGDFTGRVNVLGKMLLSHYSPIRDINGEVLGMLFVGLDTSAKDTRLANDTLVMIIGILVMTAIALCIAVIVAKNLARPIQAISAAAKQLAAGEIDVEIAVTQNEQSKDETAQLAMAFSDMINANRERARLIGAVAVGDLSGSIMPRSENDVVGNALNELLNTNNQTFYQITKAASHLDLASTQVADGANSLAQGATEQSAAIEELSSTVSEVSDSSKQNAQMASRISNLAAEIKNNASKGSSQMKQMLLAVQEINDASEDIVKVIKVVDDIAFQTNILALNAAVEAARAGQHGKGFAVVAEEVRNLAAKSAEAARDTSELIAGSVEKAHLGTRIANETAQSLGQIVEGIDESDKLIAVIANSFMEQNAALDQINVGIDQVAHIVQQNTASAQESAAASEEMSGQSTMLHSLMGQFKIRNDEQAAIGTGQRMHRGR